MSSYYSLVGWFSMCGGLDDIINRHWVKYVWRHSDKCQALWPLAYVYTLAICNNVWSDFDFILIFTLRLDRRIMYSDVLIGQSDCHELMNEYSFLWKHPRLRVVNVSSITNVASPDAVLSTQVYTCCADTDPPSFYQIITWSYISTEQDHN